MGEPAVASVLARLPPSDQQELGRVLPASWYPFEMQERLDDAIAAHMGIGEKIFRLLGEQSARDNLASTHRAFVDAHDPHGLLQHAASIHEAYYDTGRREYERVGPNVAVLRTFDCLSTSRAECLSNMGWHQAAIEICGGQRARVSDPFCRARGDGHCEYLCEWD
ncbi:MAG TPA: TIGR02265 family protein, partial [Vicinamibacteria bacterium]|nr:TIGR02265 family protein [Vicinamibacteria bacterium]